MLNFGKSWNPEDNLISMGKSFIINTSSRERKKKKQGKNFSLKLTMWN